MGRRHERSREQGGAGNEAHGVGLQRVDDPAITQVFALNSKSFLLLFLRKEGLIF
jgi:hypothetical protein